MLPHVNNLGRGLDSYNLIRKDRTLPWTEDNVIAAPRRTVVERKKAGYRTYLPPHELKRRKEAMEKYRLRGYQGRRYRRYDQKDEQ